jgi:hypothetical protein
LQWQPDSEHTHEHRGYELPEENCQKRDSGFDEEHGHGKNIVTPKTPSMNILGRLSAKNRNCTKQSVTRIFPAPTNIGSYFFQSLNRGIGVLGLHEFDRNDQTHFAQDGKGIFDSGESSEQKYWWVR